MYNTIYNPKTRRKVNIYSKLGKQIIRNYLKIVGGGHHNYENTTPWEILGVPIDINITKQEVNKAYHAADTAAASASTDPHVHKGAPGDIGNIVQFFTFTRVGIAANTERQNYRNCITPTWTSGDIRGNTYTFRNPWYVPPPTTPPPRMFSIGNSVIIRDLVNRQDLNGCRGTILSFAVSRGGVYRYNVSRRGAQTIEISEPNLISTDLEEPRYNIGDDVEIHGFAGYSQFNGRGGRITSEGKCPLNPLDVTYYNYDVELSPGETHSFQERNLRRRAAPPPDVPIPDVPPPPDVPMPDVPPPPDVPLHPVEVPSGELPDPRRYWYTFTHAYRGFGNGDWQALDNHSTQYLNDRIAEGQFEGQFMSGPSARWWFKLYHDGLPPRIYNTTLFGYNELKIYRQPR